MIVLDARKCVPERQRREVTPLRRLVNNMPMMQRTLQRHWRRSDLWRVYLYGGLAMLLRRKPA